MFDPFSRRPVTPQEMRARTRALIAELEGLSIAELMRGGRSSPTQHGVSSGSGGDSYDPNQPRVPAGHSDGGQWTSGGGSGTNDPRVLSDATPDNDWIPGADYAAVGHHWVPRQFYLRHPFSREVRKIFREETSGQLSTRVWSAHNQQWLTHVYDDAHRQYNAGVDELVTRYMRERGIAAQQMTPEQAREVVEAIHRSTDPRIEGYNRRIRTMRRFFRLYGPRGSE